MSERIRLAKEMVEGGLKPSEIPNLIIELLGKSSAHQLYEIINDTLPIEEWPVLTERMNRAVPPDSFKEAA